MSFLSQTAIAIELRDLAPKPKPTCNDVIDKCNKALKEKNAEIALTRQALEVCTSQRGEMVVEIEELRDDKSAWYRNPFILVPMSILTGALGYAILTR